MVMPLNNFDYWNLFNVFVVLSHCTKIKWLRFCASLLELCLCYVRDKRRVRACLILCACVCAYLYVCVSVLATASVNIHTSIRPVPACLWQGHLSAWVLVTKDWGSQNKTQQPLGVGVRMGWDVGGGGGGELMHIIMAHFLSSGWHHSLPLINFDKTLGTPRVIGPGCSQGVRPTRRRLMAK